MYDTLARGSPVPSDIHNGGPDVSELYTRSDIDPCGCRCLTVFVHVVIVGLRDRGMFKSLHSLYFCIKSRKRRTVQQLGENNKGWHGAQMVPLRNNSKLRPKVIRSATVKLRRDAETA